MPVICLTVLCCDLTHAVLICTCRYRLFAEPPMLDDEEGMRVLQCLTCPMDLLTMLYKVGELSCAVAAVLLSVRNQLAVPEAQQQE